MASEPVEKASPKQPGAVARLPHDGKDPHRPIAGAQDCASDGSVPCGPTGKSDKGLAPPSPKA